MILISTVSVLFSLLGCQERNSSAVSRAKTASAAESTITQIQHPISPTTNSPESTIESNDSNSLDSKTSGDTAFVVKTLTPILPIAAKHPSSRRPPKRLPGQSDAEYIRQFLGDISVYNLDQVRSSRSGLPMQPIVTKRTKEYSTQIDHTDTESWSGDSNNDDDNGDSDGAKKARRAVHQ